MTVPNLISFALICDREGRAGFNPWSYREVRLATDPASITNDDGIGLTFHRTAEETFADLFFATAAAHNATNLRLLSLSSGCHPLKPHMLSNIASPPNPHWTLDLFFVRQTQVSFANGTRIRAKEFLIDVKTSDPAYAGIMRALLSLSEEEAARLASDTFIVGSLDTDRRESEGTPVYGREIKELAKRARQTKTCVQPLFETEWGLMPVSFSVPCLRGRIEFGPAQ